MTALEKARWELEQGGYTCVLCGGELVRTHRARGVKPLVEFLDSGEDFSGWAAADKVVGKATAFLYVLLGVKAVYTPVISRGALEVLEKYGIQVTYRERVAAIFNRSRDGFCPMETATSGCDTPEEALAAIRETLEKMKNKRENR